MTISYASEVPNGSSFGCFWRILVKWRGSVYKLIWRELLAYLFVYYLINFTYRYALNEQQRAIFEKIRYYFGNSSESIPMSFVLGFYVSLVVKRWWEQYKLLPWPDNLALFISAAIPGNVQFFTSRNVCPILIELARNNTNRDVFDLVTSTDVVLTEQEQQTSRL
ncbi:hypothetical protein M0802_012792 [Mischocyttarus mexicanus]|nr:hypothetical protein M0802_012792 [Mischocyttarus mexicanus]